MQIVLAIAILMFVAGCIVGRIYKKDREDEYGALTEHILKEQVRSLSRIVANEQHRAEELAKDLIKREEELHDERNIIRELRGKERLQTSQLQSTRRELRKRDLSHT